VISPKRIDLDAIKEEVKKVPVVEKWWPTEVPSTVSIVCPLESSVKLRKLKFPEVDGKYKTMKVNSGLEFSKHDLAGFTRTGIKLTTTYALAVDVAGSGIRYWEVFPQQLVFLASDEELLGKELSIVKDGFYNFKVEPTKKPAYLEHKDDGERMLRTLDELQRTHPTDPLLAAMAEF